MGDGRTESIRVRVTLAEKVALQGIANEHTNGNVGELLRNRALGVADVAAPMEPAVMEPPAAPRGPTTLRERAERAKAMQEGMDR